MVAVVKGRHQRGINRTDGRGNGCYSHGHEDTHARRVRRAISNHGSTTSVPGTRRKQLVEVQQRSYVRRILESNCNSAQGAEVTAKVIVTRKLLYLVHFAKSMARVPVPFIFSNGILLDTIPSEFLLARCLTLRDTGRKEGSLSEYCYSAHTVLVYWLRLCRDALTIYVCAWNHMSTTV